MGSIQKQAMSGIGTGYDLSTTTFSPDGRVFQVEYAGKAIDSSGTVLAVKCKDGIVMAVEKMVRSKLLVEGSNRRSFIVSKKAGMAVAGFQADARQIVLRARSECEQYKSAYGGDIPPHVLNDRVASFMHLYTVYWSVRPFGVGVIMAHHGRDGYELYQLDQAGAAYRCYAAAIGKARYTSWVRSSTKYTMMSRIRISNWSCHGFVMVRAMKDEIEVRIKAALEEESDDDDDDDD